MKILILNGPNLNLLGIRQPGIYGNERFEDYLVQLRGYFPEIELIYRQSNSEGDIIDILHEFGFSVDGIIFNPGGYTHTSVAIADAIRSIHSPVVEVHISLIFGREPYRQKSITAPACMGFISGFGLDSYRLAVESFLLKK
ncbi:MAG: 3-dehydroquinate dehydratase [Bacteroidales bacterium]|jgi:3-dehydroquinate dehydratase-2|nr:3-dehydroquinate dehydratase [Bacteroidales bacterium]MDN5330489.1 3-dehydroquinate dehydratase [Bacteroidales bacterium]